MPPTPRISSSGRQGQQPAQLLAQPGPGPAGLAEHAGRGRATPPAGVGAEHQLGVADAAQADGQGASEGFGGPGLLIRHATHAAAGEDGHRRRARRRRPARRPATPTANRPRPRRSRSCTCPGVPSVARSTSPGRPPPTLRMTSCRARPMVALARLPCPKALMPEFIPMARLIGPLTTTTGPTNQVVASTPCMLNSSVHTASTARQHHRQVLGAAPGHDRVDRHFLHRGRRQVRGNDRPPPHRALGRCRPAWPAPASPLGGTTGSRRSSPGPTWPRARPPAHRGAPAGTGARRLGTEPPELVGDPRIEMPGTAAGPVVRQARARVRRRR